MHVGSISTKPPGADGKQTERWVWIKELMGRLSGASLTIPASSPVLSGSEVEGFRCSANGLSRVVSASRNATLKLHRQKEAGIPKKLTGFGIGLRAVTIAMGTQKNGHISAAISMTSVLIVALIESMQRNLPAVLFGDVVADGVVMIARSGLIGRDSQKQRQGSFLMMNMMRWIFGTKTKLAARGVRQK